MKQNAAASKTSGKSKPESVAPAKRKRDAEAAAPTPAAAEPEQAKGKGKGKAKTKPAESEDEDDSDADEEVPEGEIIDVEFDFFGMVDTDYHAVKRFLTLCLGPDAQDKLQGLVDVTELLISQGIGTGVKCDGEASDPYALATVLGLTGPQWGGHRAVKPVAKFLVERSSNDAKLAKLLAPDTDRRVGLVVYERLINMPWQVAAPLFSLLHDEMESSPVDPLVNPDEDDLSFRFDDLIFLCPMFRPDEDEAADAAGAAEAEAEKAKKRKMDIKAMLMGKKKGGADGASKDMKLKRNKQQAAAAGPMPAAAELAAYSYFEQEYIAQARFSCSLPPLRRHAKFTFTLKHVQPKSELDDGMSLASGLRGDRRGLVVPASKMPAILKTLDKLVAESEGILKQEHMHATADI
ncbi:Mss4p nuclear export [Blastocladiella emersonii ATCC 22665]|nr:Mss4p nuclear export [Blastocladiella emersonii ATCC 22665]